MGYVVELATKGPYDVVQEALFVLANIITQGHIRDANWIVQRGAIKTFCLFLERLREPKLTIEVLLALKQLFQYNELNDLGYIRLFEECGGLDSLERLQDHANAEVFDSVTYLLKTFFDTIEEEDQNILPAATETMFEFGTSELPSKQLFPTDSSGASSPPLRFNFGGNSAMNTGN